MEKNQIAAILALASLLMMAGCAQLAVSSTVTADGEISEYEMNITTSRMAYGYIESTAEEEGYESVREYLLSDLNESQAESITYDEEYDGDQVKMMLKMEDVDPAAADSLDLREEDGKLVYVDEIFYNESYEQGEESGMSEAITNGLAVDYYLTMPGEITDSNADSVDGNTAEWHASGADAFQDTRIYAESEKPSALAAPGFGVGAAALALLLSAFLLKRRD